MLVIVIKRHSYVGDIDLTLLTLLDVPNTGGSVLLEPGTGAVLTGCVFQTPFPQQPDIKVNFAIGGHVSYCNALYRQLLIR